MNTYKVADLNEGKYFKGALYLDEQFILLDKIMPFTTSLKKALTAWNFTEVFSEGEPEGAHPKVDVKLNEFEEVNIDDLTDSSSAPKKNEAENSQIKKVLEDVTAAASENSEEKTLELVKKAYSDFHTYINHVYTRFVTHRELSLQQISESVDAFCNFVKANEQYVLRFAQSAEEKSDKNFIVDHSIRTTVYAIAIGLHLKMPHDKLVELGVTAMLHEIGQIKLPPQLYITDRALSKPERAQLSTHPILGFNIVKENNFPLAIQLGVLEHHERENGKGYPRHLFGPKISLYGKILSVVCSFEAITAPRHYKEQRTTFEAMIELLGNQDKQYDDIVMKAFVQALSIFPIGAYVYLSNGKIAQVVNANANDPTKPIVQIFGEKDEKGQPRKIQTDNAQFKIVRVLNKQELGALIKALARR